MPYPPSPRRALPREEVFVRRSETAWRVVVRFGKRERIVRTFPVPAVSENDTAAQREAIARAAAAAEEQAKRFAARYRKSLRG